MYSQLNDDVIIADFFKDKVGRFLDIGANNGITFSNTRNLFDKGWTGVLVEPDPGAFAALVKNYVRKNGVKLCNLFVDAQDGIRPFHVCNDSLLSTGNEAYKEIWKTQEYVEVSVSAVSVNSLFRHVGSDFQFITLDAEGLTFDLLRSFPHAEMNTDLWCVEYDSANRGAMIDYMLGEGFRLHDENALNLFFARP